VSRCSKLRAREEKSLGERVDYDLLEEGFVALSGMRVKGTNWSRLQAPADEEKGVATN